MIHRSIPAVALIAGFFSVTPPVAGASEDGGATEPRITGGITGYYYAIRDQSDYGVGVATGIGGQAAKPVNSAVSPGLPCSR